MKFALVLLAQAPLWEDVNDRVLLPETAEWTSYVELADVDGYGRVDFLFANSGDYSEPNRIVLNRGERFEEMSLPGVPDIARVIRVRDDTGDGHVYNPG